MGSAAAQGPLWGARARDWAELAEPAQTPFYDAVFDAIGVGPDTRLLDVGVWGLHVPQVDTPEIAREVVQAARYAPAGMRGMAGLGAHVIGDDARECLLCRSSERCPGKQQDRQVFHSEVIRPAPSGARSSCPRS